MEFGVNEAVFSRTVLVDPRIVGRDSYQVISLLRETRGRPPERKGMCNPVGAIFMPVQFNAMSKLVAGDATAAVSAGLHFVSATPSAFDDGVEVLFE